MIFNIDKKIAILALLVISFFGCKVNEFDYLPKYDPNLTSADPLTNILAPNGIAGVRASQVYASMDLTGRVELHWAHVDGAEVYKIYRSSTLSENKADWTLIGESSTFSSDGVFFQDLEVVAGELYYYRVTIVDRKGVEGIMSPLTLAGSGQAGNGIISGVINDIQASEGTRGQTIEVSWASFNGAHYYKVYRSEAYEDGTVGPKILAGTHYHIANAPRQEFLDNKQFEEGLAVEPGKFYRYWVVAFNLANEQTALNEQNYKTGFIFPTPFDVVATLGTRIGEIEIKWDYDSRFKNYPSVTFDTFRIYSSSLPGGVAEAPIDKQTYFGIFIPNEITEYPFERFFRVTAVFIIGTETIETRKSIEVKGSIVNPSSITPNADFPLAINSSIPSAPGVLDLFWPDMNSSNSQMNGQTPSKYIVYRSTSENGFYTKRGEVAVKEGDNFFHFRDYSYSGEGIEASIEASTEYWYRIVCSSANGAVGGFSSGIAGYVTSPVLSSSGQQVGDSIVLNWEASEDPLLANYLINKKSIAPDLSESNEELIVASTAITFSDNYIDNDWTYEYTVYAQGPFIGASRSTSIASEKISVKVLPIPVINNSELMEAVGGADLTVAWDQIEEAEGYKVYKSATNNAPAKRATLGGELIAILDGDTFEFADTSVSAGQGGWYWVTAIYPAEESDFSSPVYGYKLGSVENVFISPVFVAGSYDGKVLISWPEVQGATSYALIYSLDGVDQPHVLTANLAEEVELSVGVTLNVMISAFNVRVEGGPLSDSVEFIYNNEAASAQNLTASKGDFAQKVELSWDAPSGITVSSYKIFRDDETISEIDGSLTTYTDSSPTRGKIHYYSIVAVDSEFNEGSPSIPEAGYILNTPQNITASQGIYRDRVRVTFDSEVSSFFFALEEAPEVALTTSLVSGDDGHYVYDLLLDETLIGEELNILISNIDTESAKVTAPAIVGYVLGLVENITASEGDFLNRIEVKWEVVPRAQRYRIWFTTNPTPSSEDDWSKIQVVPEIAEVEGVTYATYQHPTAPAGLPVYYKVQAMTKAGGEGAILPLAAENTALGFILAKPININFEDNGVATVAGSGTRGTDSTNMKIIWDSLLSEVAVGEGSLEVIVEATSKNGVDCNPSGTTYPLLGEFVYSGYGTSASSPVPVGTPIDFTIYLRRTLADSTVVDGPSESVTFTPVFNAPIIRQDSIVDGVFNNESADVDMTVAWDGISADYINGYVVYRSRTKDDLSTYSALNLSTSGSSLVTAADTGEIASDAPSGRSGAYFYRIKARNSVDSLSEFSDALEVYKKPDRINPNSLASSNRAIVDAISIQWANIKGVDKYKVYYSWQSTTRVESDIAAVVSATMSMDTVSFELTHLVKDGSPLKPGSYTFWVRPVVSSQSNGGIRADLDGNVAEDRFTSGSIELTDDRWIKEVLKEMRASAETLGRRNEGHWEWSKASWGSRQNWACGSNPNNIPDGIWSYSDKQIVPHNKGIVNSPVLGERVLSSSTTVFGWDACYTGHRYWYKNSSQSGYMTIFGTVWDFKTFTGTFGGQSGRVQDSRIFTRYVNETYGNPKFGPIEITGPYPGYLQLGNDTGDIDSGLSANHDADISGLSNATGGKIHIARDVNSSAVYTGNASSPINMGAFTTKNFNAGLHWN
ncbi:MAG: hypothetical protein JXR63_12295 [Spirochaetales bacterium]|nr:hypothetical protein [Spirochaetales bacterium]